MNKSHFLYFLISIVPNWLFYQLIYAKISSYQNFSLIPILVIFLNLFAMLIFYFYSKTNEYLSSEHTFIKNTSRMLWIALLYSPALVSLTFLIILLVATAINKDNWFLITLIFWISMIANFNIDLHFDLVF